MADDNTPARRSCGTMAEFHRLAELDSGYRARLAGIEDTTQKALARMNVAKLKAVTVPVVVHVVYKSADQNITDAQIQSQLDVLNADYNATNADRPSVPAVWGSLVGNAKINFKLAKKDPGGAATGGIIRKNTKIAGFGPDDGVKFAASGGAHKRAQLFAEAMHGRVKAKELVDRVNAKRNQHAVRAHGLLPLPKGDAAKPQIL